MKDSIVLSVSGLSKVYRHNGEQKTFGAAVRALFSGKKNRNAEFSALEELSFELRKGEVLGIIGRNGAGKSTLMKILAGITPPSAGEVRIEGRVAAVLDIGTGFHPELSGRENIRLSGELLGMRPADVRSRESAIIRFSGIANFIDDPVKHYSSGMFLRLAFSIAAHLDAEILLLDEVLSVGDSEFSLKSFRKMRELLSEGRSVILVSHDLGSVAGMCDRCILLEKGRLKAEGKPSALVAEYLESTMHAPAQTAQQKEEDNQDSIAPQSDIFWGSHRSWEEDKAPGNSLIRILQLELKQEGAQAQLRSDLPLQFRIRYRKLQSCETTLSLFLAWRLREPLLTTSPASSLQREGFDFEAGMYEAQVEIPGHWLNGGLFSAGLYFVNPDESMVLSLPDLLAFRIDNPPATDSKYVYDGNFPGPLFPSLPWKTLKQS